MIRISFRFPCIIVTFLPDVACFPFVGRMICWRYRWQFISSVTSVCRSVAGSGYFKLFSYVFFKFILRCLNATQQRLAFYLHPWEPDPGQPRLSVPLLFGFRHYVNLHETEKNLWRLLNDIAFERIEIAYNVAQQAGA